MKIIFCKKCNKFHDTKVDCTSNINDNFLSNKNTFLNSILKCNYCNGTGNLSSSKKVYFGFADGKYPCPACKGTGKVKNFNG